LEATITIHGGRFRGKRKEIRILSERERENFFDAVNALKKDRVSDKRSMLLRVLFLYA
jgi:hypothetical protein